MLVTLPPEPPTVNRPRRVRGSSVTAEATYEVPAPEPVAEDVWSIPIPLVGSPIGAVTIYAVRHAAGVLLVDAGYDDEAGWAALEAGLDAMGVTPAAVTGIVLTHSHPDHVGLANRIRALSGAWVAIHPLDALAERWREHGTFLEQLDTELRLAGAPDKLREEMVEASRRLSRQPQQLRADRFLADGETIAEHELELEVVATPGHTRGHVCLLDRGRRLLFGGDLVLGTGEVQLGLVALPADDPAADLERSLLRVASLPADLVLPGHYERFGDMESRCASVVAELRARVAQAWEVVQARPGCTAWELAEAFPWQRPWERMGVTSRRFGVMQATAWQRRLASLGLTVLEPGPPERSRPAAAAP